MLGFLFLWNCSINKYESIRWQLELSVFDVATYILQKRGDMSCMKLQKLCYYAQAWSLVWDTTKLNNTGGRGAVPGIFVYFSNFS